MAEWIPIKRAGIRVNDQAHASGQIVANVDLNFVPPEEWIAMFNSSGAPIPLGRFGRPQLASLAQEIRVQVLEPDDLKGAVAYIDESIEMANRKYASEVLPREQHESDVKAAEQARQALRIGEAKRVARDL